MPKRVILHAGFHLTGTTAIQSMLRRDRMALSAFADCILPDALRNVAKAARRYAATRDPLDLGFFQYEAALVIETWNAETVLVSCEDLSGAIPGTRDLPDYGAAPALGGAMVEVLEEAAPGVETTLVYTTRSPEAWLNNCHDHHLVHSRLSINRARFYDDFGAAAAFAPILGELQAAAVDAELRAIPVDAHSDRPQGAAAPLLSLAGVPQDIIDHLAPMPRIKSGLSRTEREDLLLLNRSGLSDAEVAARKKGLG